MFFIIPLLAMMLIFNVIGGLFRFGGSVLGFFIKLMLGVFVFGFIIYAIGFAVLFVLIPVLLIKALVRPR